MLRGVSGLIPKGKKQKTVPLQLQNSQVKLKSLVKGLRKRWNFKITDVSGLNDSNIKNNGSQLLLQTNSQGESVTTK